jgi:hypothetical protein
MSAELLSVIQKQSLDPPILHLKPNQKLKPLISKVVLPALNNTETPVVPILVIFTSAPKISKYVKCESNLYYCLSILGSVSGQCNSNLSSQFTRYCGFFLGLQTTGQANQPICGKDV